MARADTKLYEEYIIQSSQESIISVVNPILQIRKQAQGGQVACQKGQRRGKRVINMLPGFLPPTPLKILF